MSLYCGYRPTTIKNIWADQTLPLAVSFYWKKTILRYELQRQFMESLQPNREASVPAGSKCGIKPVTCPPVTAEQKLCSSICWLIYAQWVHFLQGYVQSMACISFGVFLTWTTGNSALRFRVQNGKNHHMHLLI